jgi:putative ABC transport system ATP-binding protein
MNQPLIKARSISKIFGTGPLSTTVLGNISFELPRGQLTLLMGPSGSGKTTLVSILLGLLTPTNGSVYLCGDEISNKPQQYAARVRRRNVGFVFQTPNLFPALSAVENVAEVLRLKGMTREQANTSARQALERVGMGNRGGHLPSQLSGGQKQRVAIARAIADGPELIVADEMTSALDSASGNAAMELIRAHVDGSRSALLVTHDRRLERFADRVVELEDGRIVSDRSTFKGVRTS